MRPQPAEKNVMPFLAVAIVSGLLLGLEQFDRIAGGVIENDLRASRPRDDVVAELESRVTQALDFSGEILHLNMNPVPTAGHGFATIGHGPASGAGLSAEQKTHAVTGDRCKRRAGILFDFKAEVCCVEFDGDGNVVDHVADANRRHTLVLLLFRTPKVRLPFPSNPPGASPRRFPEFSHFQSRTRKPREVSHRRSRWFPRNH